MFRKRTKKEFPPGTFIATPARVMAILQLCLALMVLLWQLSQPFLGDFFAIRSKMAVYEYVMGSSNGSLLQKRNASRFQELPPATQEVLKKNYARWQNKLQDSFLTKLRRSFEGLFFEMSLFEKIWLALALVLPILILLKVEGAIQAAWLLPIIAFAYAVDNRQNGTTTGLSAELQLFPTEIFLMEKYSAGEIDPSPFKQKEMLEASWQAYLIHEWAHATPSEETAAFNGQVEEGEYAFTTARALAIKEAKTPKFKRESNALFILYLLWNIAFAYTVTKYQRRNHLKLAGLEKFNTGTQSP